VRSRNGKFHNNRRGWVFFFFSKIRFRRLTIFLGSAAETLLLQVDHESSCYLSLCSKSCFCFHYILVVYDQMAISWGGRRKFFRSSTKMEFQALQGILSIRPVLRSSRCFWLAYFRVFESQFRNFWILLSRRPIWVFDVWI